MRKRILSLGLSIAILASASAGLGFAARASETAGEGMTEEQMQIETEPEEELPAEGLPAEITFPENDETEQPEEIYTDAAGQVISAETAQALDNSDMGVTNIENTADPEQAAEDVAQAAEETLLVPEDNGAEDMDKSTIGAAFDSNYQFDKEDATVYVLEAVAVKAEPSDDAEDLRTLDKYSSVHLTGSNGLKYWEVRFGDEIGYLDCAVITRDRAEMEALREDDIRKEETEAQSKQDQEATIAEKATETKDEWVQALKESRRAELAKQTRSLIWNGAVLSRSKGSVYGPSGKETYYNLNMSGCVRNMNRRGYYYDVWVRDDGCKMFGDYIMCAANLGVHPFGSLVECSLGTCIVVDTGGFAAGNPNQLDIAVTW